MADDEVGDVANDMAKMTWQFIFGPYSMGFFLFSFQPLFSSRNLDFGATVAPSFLFGK